MLPVLLLLLLLATAFLPPVALPAAAAAGATDTSVIALTSVDPPIAGPGVPVTITGTLTAGPRALANPTVRVVLGGAPIVSRGDVARWVGDTRSLTGPELARTTTAGIVGPGQRVPFSLAIPAGKAALPRAWGVVPVAITAGDADPAHDVVLRTFLGWQRTKQYQPLSLAVVAPVTLSPDPALFDADPGRRAAAWRHELAPTGRIQRILDGTDVTGPSGPVPVTWAVDPAILGRDRRTVPQAAADPVSPLVVPLLTRLAASAGRHPLWALPYGDADLAATVTTSPADPTVGSQIQRSATLESVLGVPVRSGVAWLADGGLEAPREQGLRTAYGPLGPAAALVSSSALPTVSGFSGTGDRKSPAGIPLLAWDDALSRLTLQTGTADGGALMTQQFLAETATLLAESPGIERTFVVAIPRSIDPDPQALRAFLGALAATPWIRFVTTDQVQQQAAAREPVSAVGRGTWELAGPAQVDAAALQEIIAERRTIERVARVLGDNGADYRTQWDDTLDQLTSVRWRSAPGARAALTAAVAQAGSQATSGVRVAAQTTNFLADEGVLQVTVVNDLEVPVVGLRLVLTPTNPRLRIVAQPDPVRIEARSRAVIPVRVRAVAAGLVPVTATLTTSDGTALGRTATITVRANPPGRIFYVVSGAIVALVLVLGLARTLRRRRPAAS